MLLVNDAALPRRVSRLKQQSPLSARRQDRPTVTPGHSPQRGVTRQARRRPHMQEAVGRDGLSTALPGGTARHTTVGTTAATRLFTLRCIAEQREYYDVPPLDQPVDPLQAGVASAVARALRPVNTPPFAPWTGCPRPALCLQSEVLVIPTLMRSPKASGIVQGRARALGRALARPGRPRAGDLDLGRLVNNSRIHSSLEYQTPAGPRPSTTVSCTPPPSTCSRRNRPGRQPGASPPVVVIRSRPQGAHDRGV